MHQIPSKKGQLDDLRVVLGVDEELRTARVGLAGVGHREGHGFVRQTQMRGEFVLDLALSRASLGAGAFGVEVKRWKTI